MLRRMLTLGLVITLLAAMIPSTLPVALAGGNADYSADQLAAAVLRAGTDDSSSPYRDGMKVSSSMNGMQLQGWLESFISGDLGSVMSVLNDAEEEFTLRPEIEAEGTMIAQAFDELQSVQSDMMTVQDEAGYYLDVIEDACEIISLNTFYLENPGPDTTDMQILEFKQRIMEADADLKQAKAGVLDSYERWQDSVSTVRAMIDTNAADSENTSGSGYGRLLSIMNEENAANSDPLQTVQSGQFSIAVMNDTDIAVQVKDSKLQPVAGAVVTITDGSSDHTDQKTTGADGSAIFDMTAKGFQKDKNGYYTINTTVTKDGYKSVTRFRELIKGGTITPVTAKETDGRSYISGIFFDGMDVLTENHSIYFSTKNDSQSPIDIGIVAGSDGIPAGSKVRVNYQEFAGTYSSGQANLKDAHKDSDALTAAVAPGAMAVVTVQSDWNRKAYFGTAMTVSVLDANEKEILTENLHLEIRDGFSDEPLSLTTDMLSTAFGSFLYGNSNTGAIGASIGKLLNTGLPFLNKATVNFDLPNFPVNCWVNVDGSFFLAFGLNSKAYTGGDEQWKTNNETKKSSSGDWADRQNHTSSKEIMQGMMDKTKSKGLDSKITATFHADFNLFAGLIGKIPFKSKGDGHERVTLEGTVGASVTGTFTHTQQIWATVGPVPVPLFVSFELGLSVGFEISLGASFDSVAFKKGSKSDLNLNWSYDTGLTILVNLSFGVTAGLGIKGVLEVSIKGYAYVSLLFRIGTHMKVGITAGASVSALLRIFIAKFSVVLWSGKVEATAEDQSGVEETSAGNTANEDTRLVYDTSNEPQAVIPQNVSTLIDNVQLTNAKTGSCAGSDYIYSIERDESKKLTRLISRNIETGAVETFENVYSDDHKASGYDYAFAVCTPVTDDGKIIENTRVIAILSNNGSRTVSSGSGDVRVPTDTEITYVIEETDSNGKTTSGGSLRYLKELDDRYLEQISLSCVAEKDGTGYRYEIQTVCTANNLRDIYVDKISFTGEQSSCTFSVTGSKEHVIETYSMNDNDAYLIIDEDEDDIPDRIDHQIFGGKGSTIAEGDYTSLEILRSYYNKKDDSGKVSYIHDRIFYVVRETENDVEKCKLKNMVVDWYGNSPTVTEQRDFNVELSSGLFGIGYLYGCPYIYWVQEDTDSELNEKGELIKQNSLMCCAYDPGYNLVSEPYVLCQLRPETADHTALSVGKVLFSASASEKQQEGRIIYSISNDDGSCKLDCGNIRLQANLDIETAYAVDSVLHPGDTDELKIKVSNKGNISATNFELDLYRLTDGVRGKNPCAKIYIDTTKPENSKVYTLDEDTGDVLHEGIYPYGIRMGSSTDDYTQKKSNTVVTCLENGKIVTDDTETSVLMPDSSCVVKANIRIPADWEAGKTYSFELELASLTQSKDWTAFLSGTDTVDGETISLTGAEDHTSVYVTKDEQVDGLLEVTAAEEGPDLSMYSKLGTFDVETLDTSAEDLRLDAALTLISDEWYVDLNICDTAPYDDTTDTDYVTLKAYLDSTDNEVYSVNIPIRMSDGFTYSTAIPLKTIIGDNRDAQDLILRVEGNHRNGSEYSEIGTYDNREDLVLPKTLSITKQPTNVSVYEKKNATFTCEAIGDYPPIEYRWYRHAVGSTDEWTVIEGADQPTLQITDVTLEMDDTEFVCVVRDSTGYYVRSQSAVLKVKELPDTGVSGYNVLIAAAAFIISLAGIFICLRYKRRRNCR